MEERRAQDVSKVCRAYGVANRVMQVQRLAKVPVTGPVGHLQARVWQMQCANVPDISPAGPQVEVGRNILRHLLSE